MNMVLQPENRIIFYCAFVLVRSSNLQPTEMRLRGEYRYFVACTVLFRCCIALAVGEDSSSARDAFRAYT